MELIPPGQRQRERKIGIKALFASEALSRRDGPHINQVKSDSCYT